MKIDNIKTFYVLLIWLIWLVAVIYFSGVEVSKDLISYKEGHILGAHCVQSRTTSGVKFKVKYKKESKVKDDFFLLPYDVICGQELIKKIVNKKIRLSVYKNRYLGVEVDGEKIRPLEQSINEENNKTSVIVLLTTLAFFLTYSVIRITAIKNQGVRTLEIK